MNKEELFTNREISWLMFNERVLREALDSDSPLMERLKFIAIFSSNLDEFFMVRVAGLKGVVSAGYGLEDTSSGLSPERQLDEIGKLAHELTNLQQEIFCKLQKELKEKHIYFNPPIGGGLEEMCENIFIDEIISVITPVTIDPAHPFPVIFNRRISLIVSLEREGKLWYSLIMLPENMRRFFKVELGGKRAILTAEYVIQNNLSRIYKGFKVRDSHVFRITRDADIEVQEDEAADILAIIQDSLAKRNKGAVTRVEIDPQTPAPVVDYLKSMIGFRDKDVYTVDGIIDLTFLFGVVNLYPDYLFTPLKKFSLSGIQKNKDIFTRVKEKDIYFFRPYYSFSIVSDLISAASEDPNVLAIKMTLYRTNKDSSILASLVRAAKSGKQVSVVVELKARFDEERNIGWARNLEKAGCIVTYGIAGLKIHAKCLLIVRREEETIVRYTHLATGNYNENTAEVYTDVDLITADDAIGRDAAQLFNYLMGYTDEKVWRRLSVAPFALRDRLNQLFRKEIDFAKEGKPAAIIMKMNSLIDIPFMETMYEASGAGVQIDLIVRGICGLKAQVAGLSENIRVRSIVGRFLEHARIFYFMNGGDERFFIASADLMPRNLNRRVEVMTEIIDPDFKSALRKYLDISLADNMKAWELKGNQYEKVKTEGKGINSQQYFCDNKLV